MEGSLRVQRLVIESRGALVTGVFTGRLLDLDGSLVGVDARRETVAADLVREDGCYVAVVPAFPLVLMGMVVDVDETRIEGIIPARRPTGDRPRVPGHGRPCSLQVLS